VSENPTVTLDTALSLTQVCALLQKLGHTHVSRSGISYYGSRTTEFEALVPPSKRAGTGKGRWNNRLYSVSDVVLLHWLHQLKRQGLEVRKFYRAVNWLRDKMPQALTDPETVFFITDNDELAMFYRKGSPIQLSGTPGQILLTLDGSMVKDVLDETSAALSA